MNKMECIGIEKVTLNIGAGKDTQKLDKGMVLLKELTGKAPTKTVTNKRIAAWALRPGLPIGCKVTIRGDEAKKILSRLLYAKDNKLKAKQFDTHGNLAFGVPEYIDIQDAKYLPEIGITGLEVCVTLERPGFRIKKRKKFTSKVGKTQCISKNDSIKYIQDEFKVTVEGA